METLVFREGMLKAADLLRAGELIAVPTETVYGLAGNALSESAVQAIYEVKGRPAVKPLSLMVPGSEAMELYCEAVPEAAKALAGRFWPGPLTIVLKAKAIVPSLVRAGGETVGLRCPDHPLTLDLLKRAGIPLAAPSANPSGEESPKDAGTVLDYFRGKIAGVIDGGPCGLGKESTLLDMSALPYRILRQGALPESEIRKALRETLCVIGFTGGSGCGKTTALHTVEELGGLLLDCDRIYHELLASSGELLEELSIAFPGTVTEKGLDRKTLGHLVFRNEALLQKLNAITHRHISREVERRLEDWAMQGGSLAAIDAVELISSGLAAHCRASIGILADRETRLQRIMCRDGISRDRAEERLKAQKPDSYYQEHCSHILRNDGELAAFTQNLKCILQEVMNQNG